MQMEAAILSIMLAALLLYITSHVGTWQKTIALKLIISSKEPVAFP
jgi:hypothetical protein